jgi:ribonuclease T2
MRVVFLLLISSILLVSNSCNLPNTVKVWDYDATDAIKKKRDWQVVDTKTDSWRLALSYSPTFCAKQKPIPSHLKHQCLDNKFGLIVHGLWAQSFQAETYKAHPRNCKDTHAISKEILINHLCMIPGYRLMQKEWERHGSCDFKSAKAYLNRTKMLYSALKLPTLEVLNKIKKSSYYRIKSEIIALNKHIALREEHIWIVKKKGELREVHLCYDTQFNFKACHK